MSTSYGYVCKSHEPELYSDHWVINQKGADALRTLFKMERAGKWYDTPDVMYPDQPEVTPIEIDDYRSAEPVAWLREHPRCVIALVDEYGRRWPLPGDPA